jgi:hypothetical protein
MEAGVCKWREGKLDYVNGEKTNLLPGKGLPLLVSRAKGLRGGEEEDRD